jgi:arsenate reductase
MANEAPVDGARQRVLYICVGNYCRGQLAEALSRHLTSDVIEPASAGLYPPGRIADATRAVGEESGLSFDGQSSKGFAGADFAWADLIVNLTGTPSLAVFETEKPVIDWNIDDPYGEDFAERRRIAAEIEEKVRQLAAEFRARRSTSAAA